MEQVDTKTARSQIQTYRSQVNRRLKEVLESAESPVSLYEPMRYVLEGGGKRVRPVLVLIVNEMFGGDREDAVEVAVALEILHNFTLVHDDIMDRDSQRRGRATVHTKWDIGTGVLSGDGLLALAYQVLTNVETPEILRIVRLFTQGILDICEGQAFDKEFESRLDVSLQEYLMMIERKTARLLAMSCEMGGLVSQVREQTLAKLNRFGSYLGRAFQIQDDLLEVTSTMEVMGKSLGSDLFSKKKTYVLLKALELADDNTKDHILSLLEENSRSEQEFEQAKELIARTGVIQETEQKIRSIINDALAILDQFDADVDLLKHFTLQLLNRKS